MSWFKRYATSTIGLKVLMALSGAALFGFVIVHMLGNLQVLLGPEVFDHYAATLQGTPELLWAVRLGLLAAVVVHVASAAALVRRARAARPVGYRKVAYKATTYAARTMRITGPLVLLFIAFHLLHYTIGFETVGIADSALTPSIEHCHRAADGDLVCSAYANVVKGFSSAPVAMIYIVAQLMLGLHLWHGAHSMFRTIGISNPRFSGAFGALSVGIAVFVVLGNITLPLAVLTGLVGH